jgi:hypothetical protein
MSLILLRSLSRKKSSFLGICVFILSSFFLFFLGYNFYVIVTSPSRSQKLILSTRNEYCSWREGDPVLYYLKTKLGVTYEADHWFHMAENFMVQHSILLKQNLLANSSVIFYDFDKRKFY